MNYIQTLLAALLLAHAPLAAAHRIGHGHHRSHQEDEACEALEHKLEMNAADLQLDDNDLRTLMDQAHHTLEKEEGSRLQRWSEKFNFKRIGLNALRWYNRHRSHPEVANAAANITVLLLGSHALETVGGLGLASSSLASGDLGVSELILTTVGITITVPGLDPLCLVLVGAYSKWPRHMDRALTRPRVFLTTAAKAATEFAGIPTWWLESTWREARERRLSARLDHLGPQLQRSSEDGYQTYNLLSSAGERLATLGFTVSAKGMHLNALTLTPAGRAAGGAVQLLEQLRSFGFNIRSFAREALNAVEKERLQEIQNLNFVSDLETTIKGDLIFKFHGLSFPLPKPCSEYLK